jgi:hypothetical protein
MLERMNESPEYMPFKLKLQKIMDKAELQLETEESNGWV